MTLAAGTKFGRYEIRSKIGEGGMGEVYLADDTKLDRKVALKILPTHLAGDEDRTRRFIQEAKAAAALNHPNIAQIFEIGEQDFGHYIAMEYVRGDTLRQLLSRAKMDLNRAVELAAQVSSGLSAAHNSGIIHRDIKPENLVVTSNGQIKVLDFGLAKLIERQRAVSVESELSTIYLQSSVNKTTPGIILGTVSYMSPEQARGEKVDHRTDIFSLGVVFFELVTGDRPFKGKSAIDTLHAIINDEPPPVIELNPRLPVEISEILAKALAKDLNERYQHAGDFELDLRRFKRALESRTLLSTQARPITFRDRAKRQTVTLMVIGVLFLLGVVAAAWMMGSRTRVANSGWSTTRTIAMQLTNYGGEEAYGALSPDGKSFVFVSQRGGMPDLWLRQTAGGEPVRLTNDAEQEADPIYASDGQTIYYTRIDTSGPSIWRIGALGGQTRLLVRNARMAAPSPDGRNLSYFVPDADGTGDTLVVSGLDGSGTRTLARKFTGGDLNGRAVWSPDGHWLAYNRWELFALRDRN